MSTVELEPAWLLHSTNFRDTSLIVDLFTLGHGRMSLVARSARNARPAVRALYQPFRPILVSWTGDGRLKTLIGIEQAGSAHDLDNRALACGYYLSELVLRLVATNQPQPTLFALYALALDELASGQEIEPILRRFELHLLEALGVLPDFAAPATDGQPIEPARRYRYHPANARAVRLGDTAAIAGSLLKPDRTGTDGIGEGEAAWHADGVTADAGVELDGATLLALAALELEDARVRAEARPLMKRLVQLQLGDTPLKSRALFQTLAGNGPAPATGVVSETGGAVASESQSEGQGQGEGQGEDHGEDHDRADAEALGASES